MTISPARRAAYDVLRLVERGGYASNLLLQHAEGLDPRDAALASEIVLGSLRRQPQLDHLISAFSGRSPDRLDPEVRMALRVGLYQLRYLERVPAHAAVADSVELVKRARKRSAAGFVNAVLRKVRRDPIAWPDRATELCLPPWLLERWERFYGPETPERIARAFLLPPVTYVRLPGGEAPAGVELDPTEVPGCYRVAGGQAAGLRVQDIGSQAIVPLLDLQPGQTYLDLCAAPGNKTAQALEIPVRAVAGDIDLDRLTPLKSLGCALVGLDAAAPLPFSRRFDRILLDVPCSGTGTLGRNPEIKWRLRPGDPARFHRRQALMLARALEALAPGGRLVYSTCTLEREENEMVVEKVLGRLPETVLRRIPGIHPGDGFFAAVITSS